MKHILIDPSHERRILDLRLLGFRDVQVLGRYTYTHAKTPLTLHDHGEMMEICYLADGQQSYRVGEEEFFLNGGDVLVNYPHELHGTGLQREGRGTLYWMIIKPPGPRSTFLGLSSQEGNQLWKQLNSLPKRHFQIKPEVRKILDKVFLLLDEHHVRQKPPDESNSEDVMIGINVKNYLLRYILDLIEAAGKETPLSVSQEILFVIESIKQNDDQFFSMRELARKVKLSESRFKHRFKAEVGISPADYQLRHKIDRACRLLLEGETIINITYMLGFSSSQYFATVFRRYRGVTPVEYRNSGQSGGS